MREVAAGIALVVLAAGCGKISGVDDYSVCGSSGKCGAFPVVAYLPESGICGSCLDSKCAQEQTACESDTTCKSTLECRRKCQDPACHLKCMLGNNNYKQAWDNNSLGDTLLDKLNDCARDQCGTECSIGRSWGCVGKYSWNTPPRSSQVTVRHLVLHVTPGHSEPIAGADVKACLLSLSLCKPPLAEAQTDSDGRVELQLGSSKGFAGYLSVEKPGDPADAGVPGYPDYFYFGQRARARYSNEYTSNGESTRDELDVVRSLAENADAGVLPPYQSYVWPEITDCAGFGGSKIQIELEIDGVAWSSKCQYCRVYSDADRSPDLGATYTNPKAPIVYFMWVRKGGAVITATDNDTKRTVARLSSFEVRDNAVHGLVLTPLTIDEAARTGP